MNVNTETLSALCVGLDLFKARNRILRVCPDLEEGDIDVTYADEAARRFTVLRCAYDPSGNKVRIVAASGNPIRHLPSNYQANEFVRNFLMVFQHVFNDTAIKLDNMHEYFRPMECPSGFLPTLADWFGVRLDTLGGEQEVRQFLQYAIPLYRYRGTLIGLRLHLTIVTGITPEIIEGEIPYSTLLIEDGSNVESDLVEIAPEESCFTVHFPVPRSRFDDSLMRRLSIIVQEEKPVHTRCFLSFRKPERKKRAVTTIVEGTTMGTDGGINF
jgi:phage tail-like protein